MRITNVTFGFFNDLCGRRDIAVRVSQHNDDGQHPVNTDTIRVYNSSQGNLICNGRPNIEVVNPSDCVGKKKCLCFTFRFHSLLAHQIWIVMVSKRTCLSIWMVLCLAYLDLFFRKPNIFGVREFVHCLVNNSDKYYLLGDQRHGVGDFRIPRVVLANLTGHFINVNISYPYRGIVRGPTCIYQPLWQMYYCPNNVDYRILIIESMDADTETRRLSPVAIMANGFLDLINGPQDHGWCNGYTCQKRLSTFMAIVQGYQHHDIYLSSTTPNHMRFRVLNAGTTLAVKLGLYYQSLQQVDVYVNDVYVPPTNKDPAFTQYLMLTDAPDGVAITSPVGTNYFNR